MTQETALKILQTGANVFLTGAPGSGKTHTINQYVAWLRMHGIPPAVTASTGIAATHIGGMTIHSWSGIGIKKNLSPYDLDAIASNERLSKRIHRATTLIIDEISMLGAETLDMVDAVCKEVKGNGKPFGGLQVVLVGDFFQLPPVEGNFAFCSSIWRKTLPLTCYLSEQHRQDEEIFLKLLGDIRSGKAGKEVEQVLSGRIVEEKNAPKETTRIYSHNEDVDQINEERLMKIVGKTREFKMSSHGPGSMVATLKRGCLSPEKLSLKIGAKVMFTKNSMEGKFVNGTLGEIREFGTDGLPIVKTLRGRRIEVEVMDWTITDGTKVLAKISQIPLRLAWAITVHKSQGVTLDAAIVDLTHAFEYGQGYVALSRVRSLNGLHVVGWNNRALAVHPKISGQDLNFKMESASARKAFEEMPTEDHAKLIRSFLTFSGGNTKGDVVTKKYGGKQKSSTLDTTLLLLKSGKDFAEIAESRKLIGSTVVAHVIELCSLGRITKQDVAPLIPAEIKDALPIIHAAMDENPEGRLKPIFEKFRGKYSYQNLRLAKMLKN